MNYKTIQPYVEKGLISEGIHPEDSSIRIFNYTQACQFGREWDDVTKQCRGLILNIETDEILARPFSKFFNLEEHLEVFKEKLPEEQPIVTEKFDGSLGILYSLNGKPWIATRGSFISDQAQWATKWWRDNVDALPVVGYTHLFEIIYPENRIVVNYNFSGLVYLATIRTKDGGTEFVEQPEPITSAKRIPSTDIFKLKELDSENEEGFVVFYPQSNLRLKIKFPEYVRLHKILTGLSEKGVWEHLKEKGVDCDIKEIAEDAPDEFYQWLTETADGIKAKYKDIENKAKSQFPHLPESTERREWAEEIKKMDCPSVGFSMLDGKDYSHIIWKMVRPVGAKTFEVDIDI